MPRRLQHLASLPHGEVVCAVTIGPIPAGRNPSMKAEELVASETASTTNSDHDASSPSNNVATANTPQSPVPHFAYTGGRGCVKLWDLDTISTSAAALCSTSVRDVVALASFDCLRHDSYVRSIKLFPDATGLVIGGESNALTVWDLNGPGRRKADLTFDAPACYALALSPDCKLCYRYEYRKLRFLISRLSSLSLFLYCFMPPRKLLLAKNGGLFSASTVIFNCPICSFHEFTGHPAPQSC
ncbi:unnamed protein product [Dibothriocephalus latus]|uniref:Uncharacterized protein n=1 Tax=Dibothriocephalus latus TaxID=60516 RepID=A0A3P6QB61_DIBLA|nr:unnamed protein product [Dibothriocephalus latus]